MTTLKIKYPAIKPMPASPMTGASTVSPAMPGALQAGPTTAWKPPTSTVQSPASHEAVSASIAPLNESIAILTGQRPNVSAGVLTQEQNDQKYVRADQQPMSFSPYTKMSTYQWTLEGQPYSIASATQDPMRIYTAHGNIGLRIETGTNTASDYAALRFYQGGSQSAVIYTNNGVMYMGTPTVGSAISFTGAYTGTEFKGTGSNTMAYLADQYLALQTSANSANVYLSKPTGYANSGLIQFYVNGTAVGGITTTGSATAYNTSSDYRLKENIVPLTDALTRLSTIPVYRFDWINDNTHKTVDGFLAHEVAEAVPEAVTGEKDAVDDEGNPIYQAIDQSKLVPLLVAAVQQLQQQFAAYVAAHP